MRYTQGVDITRDSGGLVVKSTAARYQIDKVIDDRDRNGDKEKTDKDKDERLPPPNGKRPPKRFHATATLNHARIGPEASRIAEEVVSHLDGLVNSEVRVTLEIEVRVPDGVPEHVERIVTENSSRLHLDAHAFEKE